MAHQQENSAVSVGDGDIQALIFARVLHIGGPASELSDQEALAWTPNDSSDVLWLHLDRSSPAVPGWLSEVLAISAPTVELLTSEETRPRAFREDDALIAVLRGINFNRGAQPEDMVAMQIWADQHRVITLRRERLQTPFDVLASVDARRGPHSAGDLVAELIEQLVIKMNHSIVDMNEQIDRLEARNPTEPVGPVLETIADIRRNCLALKRFMSPQHDALVQIGRDAPAWLSEANLRDIHETSDRLRRYIEDLDVSKESAMVLQDEINSRSAARTNKTTYMLSIVAAIFLPLSFVTGLLGINVGGMPGSHSGHGFLITVGLLVVILIAQVFFFRRLRWL